MVSSAFPDFGHAGQGLVKSADRLLLQTGQTQVYTFHYNCKSTATKPVVGRVSGESEEYEQTVNNVNEQR